MIVYAVAAGVLLVVEVVLGVYLIGRALAEKWRERKRDPTIPVDRYMRKGERHRA